MKELPINPTLKDVNSFKKKLNWGEIPTIYHMAAISIGDLDSILTDGFESGYKTIFNRSNLNLAHLGGHIDIAGDIHITHKPKIALRHIYSEQHYELHCFPVVQGERINRTLVDHEHCAFKQWHPESMRVLFRLSNLVSFIVYAFRNGDEADMALIKYANRRVSELMTTLSESFEIIDVRGFSIAKFCQAINESKSALEINQLLDDPNGLLEN
ncbi:hypothetical protein [Thalassotalea piscium]|uniref:Uncharacterized protein n=1 Tax=Thalassotalea piscium TaxID=1230533 RepID=A0A7X0NFG2_9GAMM|nr:hypothetical protein [Thalassotalea piscium]MBB6542486.1 hypothetical protein [Thalassotalea piscium]